MTTSEHSIWSAHRDGEYPHKVGDDLRTTLVTTIGKDPEGGGAQSFPAGRLMELQRTQTASMWRFVSDLHSH